MEMSMLELLEIEPQTKVRSSVIWLHGLGADGGDFEPLIKDWQICDEQGVRFVLPHAPYRPVTLNNHLNMRAWYDIYELSFRYGEDQHGIEQGRRQLLELIAREQARGIPAHRILLAGFSQGGALVLHTALRMDKSLAGVLVLSGYLPLADQLAMEKKADPASLVIRMDHGEYDDIVPFRLAEKSCNILKNNDYEVEFRRYPMGHSLCPAQMDSLRSWLAAKLG
jgi:phospholipase/carboxylesterase